jgi:hypothetical protein
MMRVRFVAPGIVLLAVLGLWRACNFDSAFQRYCANNPRCGADAAPQPEAGPDIAADAPADVGPRPELGGDARPDGQVFMYPPRSCLSSSDCWPNEMCSPLGQVCMALCRTASDCLQPGLDTCDVLANPSGMPTPKVCQCSASEVCSSFASSFFCASPDELCEHFCRVDQDCAFFHPSRRCDIRSGTCQACLSNVDCPFPGQPRCDPVLFRCSGCIGNSDCAGRPDGLTQCSSTGTCVAPTSSP